MGSFNPAIGRMLDRVYARFGEAAIHTNKDAVATPCTVVVERDLRAYGDAAQVGIKTAVVSVRLAEMPSAPRRGDRFTLTGSGKVFVVDSLQSSDEFENKVLAA